MVSARYFTTGSDELTKRPGICFVEAYEANRLYGVTIRTGGPCPECGGPAHQNLDFNPTDSYYYFKCPFCGVWLRWCDIDGNIVLEFTKVKSTKTTKLDEDLDEEYWWNF